MRQHLSTEARLRDPTYYIPNYDNMAWAAHVLMAGEMGSEASRAAAAQFVRAWMTGKVGRCVGTGAGAGTGATWMLNV
jgi:hypothetical protein